EPEREGESGRSSARDRWAQGQDQSRPWNPKRCRGRIRVRGREVPRSRNGLGRRGLEAQLVLVLTSRGPQVGSRYPRCEAEPRNEEVEVKPPYSHSGRSITNDLRE